MCGKFGGNWLSGLLSPSRKPFATWTQSSCSACFNAFGWTTIKNRTAPEGDLQATWPCQWLLQAIKLLPGLFAPRLSSECVICVGSAPGQASPCSGHSSGGVKGLKVNKQTKTQGSRTLSHSGHMEYLCDICKCSIIPQGVAFNQFASHSACRLSLNFGNYFETSKRFIQLSAINLARCLSGILWQKSKAKEKGNIWEREAHKTATGCGIGATLCAYFRTVYRLSWLTQPWNVPHSPHNPPYPRSAPLFSG